MEIISKKIFKILIVDDQQKNIQVLGSLLHQENYIIGVATNGQQALETLKESDDYDLILLDVNMPIMDGFEACIEIRKHDNLKEIPIIFLTALVETDDIVKGFEVGGQDYVTKPFNTNELLARVTTQLALKHSKDQLKQVNQWLEKKVAERTEELKVANSQLLQLDAAKSDFLHIISHEIRTPLNGIVGAVSILVEYELPQELKEMIEVLDISANRLEKFSAKALDITHFNTNGKEALRLAEVDIAEIVASQIKTLTQNAEDKNITVELLHQAAHDRCLIDKNFVGKCLYYLIDNAIKFGNPGSQVWIKTFVEGDNIVITIEDEGASFPENYQISTLRPFHTQNHVDQNPALSLFLCKQIIEMHSGQIEVSNTQKGAMVKIQLPKI